MSVDRVLSNFLRQMSVDEVDALVVFRLAPLSCRRDIAMLGVIHRTLLGQGPPAFREYFRLDTSQLRRSDRQCRHNRQVVAQFPGRNHETFRRSAFGLTWIYNMLPESVVQSTSVHEFQHNLQEFVKLRAMQGQPSWQSLLSPRIPYATHPLRY